MTGQASRLDAAGLRMAGRQPATPFTVMLADGTEIQVFRLLRVLPGKRMVGEGRWHDRQVLVKLFIARHSARHWTRERRGIEALQQAGLVTPEILQASALPGGGHILLTAYVSEAQSLAEIWAGLEHLPAGNADGLAVLSLALRLLGRLHAAGLVQEDLHLGNFLQRGDELFVIDGDAVRSISPGQCVENLLASNNLAILLAQLPPSWDPCRPELLAAYVAGGGQRPADLRSLDEEVRRVRDWRLKDYLAKTIRDCSLFSTERSAFRFTAVVRSALENLQALMAFPDAVMREGQVFKDGGTCTVVRVTLAGRELVVKRYNLKNLGHALSRFWRPSRAWHSWREGHRLRFLDIATPAPLALIEERIGPLRRRAFLVTEYCAGSNLLTTLSPDEPPHAEMAQALVSLFRTLYALRISHGDLKATNLLWDQGRIVLIDLDAMVQHRSVRQHARAWQRDRSRLLRNWPQDSVLYQWLEANLPPG